VNNMRSLVVALLAISCALVLCEQTDESAAEWYMAKAKEQAEAGGHEAAVVSLTNALKLSPGNSEAYLMRGDSLSQLGKKEEALADYKVAASSMNEDEEEEQDTQEEEGETPSGTPTSRKKVRPNELHQQADSLNIGWNEGDDSEGIYESAPPPPNDNEVEPVPNPFPEVWNDNQRSEIDNSLIEDWFRQTKNPSAAFKLPALPQEKAALLALYESMQGENWIMNGNWGNGDPCVDRWWGITCETDAEGKPTVTQVALFGNGLNGTIPEAFGDLSSLKVLNIKSNHGKGTLPESFKKLSKLEQLLLGENRFGIPMHLIKDMKQLITLDIAECHPQGSLDNLASLENLQTMRMQMAFDGLRGIIPEALGRIKSLQKLNLAQGMLHGRIPDNLGHLKELKLDGNELTGPIPPSILASKTLQKLDLSKNFMSGELAIPQGGLSEMAILVLGFNNFVANEETMNRLFEIKGLVALDITSNPNFNAQLNSKIGDIKHLHVLRLSNCGMHGEIPEEIGSLDSLYEIILDHNMMTGPVPKSVANMKNLVSLKLNNNRLSGVLAKIWNTPQLVRFSVHTNRIGGAIPSDFYHMVGGRGHLEELYLDTNDFSDFGKLPGGLKYCSAEGNPGYGRDGENVPPECRQRPLVKNGPRTFRICDTRVEIYVDVLKGHFGWEETTDDDWDTAFGECFGGHAEYRHIRNNQKIMEAPALDMIWDKGRYAANMERFRRTTFNGTSLEPFMEHIPRSFILPAQAAEFDSFFKANPGSWWLLKPRASCCGRGIKLINETHELPREQLAHGDGYIVQKFLINPWLVGPGPTSRNTWVETGKPVDGVAGPTGLSAGKGLGYKFVIRQFVVATSFEPVQMYTYPDGLLFWTRGPHTTDSKDWKDRANFITDYFFTHVQTKLQLTTSELRNLMREQGVNEQLIWADIKESVTKSFLPVAQRIAGQEGKFVARRGGTFHVWGYDIMVDADGKAVVCEINAHPNTDLEIVKEDQEPDRANLIKGDREMKMDLTEHMVRVIGHLADSPLDEEARVKYAAVVDGKLSGLKWSKPDAPCSSGFRCLKDYEYEDLITAEFEDANKGPLERNFPTASQKHLEPMLMDTLPRTKLLLHYWSGPDGDGEQYNSDGTYKVYRPPYIAPKITKRFARDEL